MLPFWSMSLLYKSTEKDLGGWGGQGLGGGAGLARVEQPWRGGQGGRAACWYVKSLTGIG